MTTPWTSRDHAAMAQELGAQRSAAETTAAARLIELLGVIYRLRDDDGCPWDRKQTLASMSKNLVEEVFETTEAIAERDDAHTCEELGDVLMNVVLMARIAEQEGRFALADVAAGIAEKLVRRHPHVFGDVSADDADAALATWNDSKAKERAGQKASALGDVPSDLPALATAVKIGKRAADTGFDWPDISGALDKLDEEASELREACATNNADRIEDELGDVLFAATNVARFAGLDPELALRRTLAKFRRRFAAIEAEFGDELQRTSLDDMERVWREAATREG